MKAKLTFRHGKWWCRRMGCTGCGNTIQEAWEDMWILYKEAIGKNRVKSFNYNNARL